MNKIIHQDVVKSVETHEPERKRERRTSRGVSTTVVRRQFQVDEGLWRDPKDRRAGRCFGGAVGTVVVVVAAAAAAVDLQYSIAVADPKFFFYVVCKRCSIS